MTRRKRQHLNNTRQNNDTLAFIPKIVVTEGASPGRCTATLSTRASLWTEMNQDDELMEREKEEEEKLF